MTTRAARPPEHLSEVFQYLSCDGRNGERPSGGVYEPFLSSYYTFRTSIQHDKTAEDVKVAVPTATASLAATTVSANSVSESDKCHSGATKCASASHAELKQEAPPLAPRNLSVAAAAAGVAKDSTTSALRTASLSLHLPSPPPSRFLSSAGAVPAFERTMPGPLSSSLQRTLSSGTAKHELCDSVGSIEFPAEQQPDSEFLSPTSRQEFVSCSNVPLLGASPPLYAIPPPDKPKELSSLYRTSRHGSESPTPQAAETHTWVRRTSEPPFSRTCAAACHLSISCSETVKVARSCSAAALAGRRVSPVFLAEGSLQTFPGMRRVSLRRPVFDAEDDCI
jgi:hypothetical protein